VENTVIRAVRGLLAPAAPAAVDAWPADTPRASVALVLRPAPAGAELLLIRRAVREGDPWSGHVALPGGRAQPEDPDPVATAVRETYEEVGIDLAGPERWLGALPAVHPQGGAPRVLVRPYVFGVPARTAATPNHEVAEAAWITADDLLHPDAAAEYLHEMGAGGPLRFPALNTRGFLVWGLTHRILADFLALYARARGG
jgi:8-oxo-dGTP pyrophosphatase MutT (NUDIX family)